MGADFLIAICPYPEDANAVYRNIKKMSDEEAIALGEEIWGETSTPDEVRSYLDEALEWVHRSPRDMAVVELEGRHYAISGGMSAGDDPTDAFSYIWALDLAGVLAVRDPIGREK